MGKQLALGSVLGALVLFVFFASLRLGVHPAFNLTQRRKGAKKG
jgi:hypothetical protein